MQNNNEKIKKAKERFWISVEKERKRSSHLKTKKLAQMMGKDDNFISAFVNSRNNPSFDTFWSYLIESGFDIEPLMNLKISHGPMKEHVKTRNQLIQIISSIEDHELLLAITEIAKALAKLSKVHLNKK